MLKHSAGGVDSSYIRAYVVHIICNAHVRVIEAENSVTLTYIIYQYKVFIALTWLFRNDYGFCVAYEYTYQDHEYIIRTVNTEHDQLVREPDTSFLLLAAHKIALRCTKHICDELA